MSEHETEALRAMAKRMRARYAAGTPEKYRLASGIVNILDFEAAISVVEARVAGLEAREARLRRALEEIAAEKPVTVDGVTYRRPGRDRARAALADSGEAGS